MKEQSTRTLVVDACTAITYAKVGRLDLVTGARGYRVVMAARARSEIRKEPARSHVAAAERAGDLTIEGVDLDAAEEVAALARYDAKPAFRGRGEAEVLALAAARGYAVASDEVPVLHAARTEFGAERVYTAASLLRLAVREERISAADAEALFERMDVAPGVTASLVRLGTSVSEWLTR